MNHGKRLRTQKTRKTANAKAFEPQIKADEKRMAQMEVREFETLKEAEKG